MIRTKAKGVQSKDAQLIINRQLESILESQLSSFVLPVRKQEHGSDFINVLSISDGFQSQVESAVNVSSSPCTDVIYDIVESLHIFPGDTLQSAESGPIAIESYKTESISGS